MRNKTSQSLYSYWNEIRAGRLAPHRFEIEPAQISAILPETFILERSDTGTYKYRLAGTKICELFGVEFRGADFLDGWRDDDRITLQRQLAAMTKQGGVSVLTLDAATLDGRTAAFEIILLPLVHSQNQLDRFLGASSPLTAPAWLGTERLLKRRLLTHELVWPDGRPHAIAEKLHAQSMFLPHMRNARIVRFDRRQFRVYDGGLSAPDGEDS